MSQKEKMVNPAKHVVALFTLRTNTTATSSGNSGWFLIKFLKIISPVMRAEAYPGGCKSLWQNAILGFFG